MVRATVVIFSLDSPIVPMPHREALPWIRQGWVPIRFPPPLVKGKLLLHVVSLHLETKGSFLLQSLP